MQYSIIHSHNIVVSTQRIAAEFGPKNSCRSMNVTTVKEMKLKKTACRNQVDHINHSSRPTIFISSYNQNSRITQYVRFFVSRNDRCWSYSNSLTGYSRVEQQRCTTFIWNVTRSRCRLIHLHSYKDIISYLDATWFLFYNRRNQRNGQDYQSYNHNKTYNQRNEFSKRIFFGILRIRKLLKFNLSRTSSHLVTFNAYFIVAVWCL